MHRHAPCTYACSLAIWVRARAVRLGTSPRRQRRLEVDSLMATIFTHKRTSHVRITFLNQYDGNTSGMIVFHEYVISLKLCIALCPCAARCRPGHVFSVASSAKSRTVDGRSSSETLRGSMSSLFQVVPDAPQAPCFSGREQVVLVELTSDALWHVCAIRNTLRLIHDR